MKAHLEIILKKSVNYKSILKLKKYMNIKGSSKKKIAKY